MNNFPRKIQLKFSEVLVSEGLYEDSLKLLETLSPDDEVNKIKTSFVDKLKGKYSEYNIDNVANVLRILYANRKKNEKNIIVTMTSCKRFDLFCETVNSFIECCRDIDKISEWIVVDDNSCEDDRKKMIEMYPFIKFVMKGENNKGHPISMNIIRKLSLDYKYNFHLEDDWNFIYKDNYLTRCEEVLELNDKFGQCLINKNYYEAGSCLDIEGGEDKISSSGAKRNLYTIHTHRQPTKRRSCTYWPHYSLRPGLTCVSRVYKVIGEYNQTDPHFEREYALRYISNNLITTFLNGIYCLHTGRRTFEMNDDTKLNAYKLNGQAQFFGEKKDNKAENNKNNERKEVKSDEKKSEEKKQPILREEKKIVKIILPPVPENELEETPRKVCTSQMISSSSSSSKDNEGTQTITTPSESKNDPITKTNKNIDDTTTQMSSSSSTERAISSYPPKEEKVKFQVRSFVINLKRRPERLQEFKKNNDPEIKDLDYHVFEAIDGYNIPFTQKIRKMFETGDYHYRKGIIGCALSHISLWYNLLNEREQNTVYCIFEDDAKVKPGFNQQLFRCLELIPSDFDVFYLGHHQRVEGKETIEDQLRIELWPRQKSIDESLGGTFGYIISRAGATKILHEIRTKGVYNAIDWVMFKSPIINYYAYPHLVKSDCAQRVKDSTSDIQNDGRSFTNNIEEQVLQDMDYWIKERNINVMATSCSTSSLLSNTCDKIITYGGKTFISDRYITEEFNGFIDEKEHISITTEVKKALLLGSICYTKISRISELEGIIRSLNHIPVKWYTIGNQYLVTIPLTKINDKVTKDITFEGFLNIDKPF